MLAIEPWCALIGEHIVAGIALTWSVGRVEVMVEVEFLARVVEQPAVLVDVVVDKVEVEVDGCGALAGVLDTFAQLPSLLGRQFIHDLPAFTQAQPLHKPVLLHLQHTIPLHKSCEKILLMPSRILVTRHSNFRHFT